MLYLLLTYRDYEIYDMSVMKKYVSVEKCTHCLTYNLHQILIFSQNTNKQVKYIIIAQEL